MAQEQQARNVPALLVSQIWHGELMDEQLFTEPTCVRMGETKGNAFTIPSVGLANKYEFFRPTPTGYTVALHPNMTGHITVSGQKQDVQTLAAGRQVHIRPGDWGVVDLSGQSGHQFVFQLTAPPPEVPMGRSNDDDDVLLAALAFSCALVLIVGLLSWLVHAPDPSTIMGFPPTPQALADYVVTRPEPPPELPKEQPRAGTADGDSKAPPASAQGAAGKSGGKGKEKRVRVKDPGDPAPSSRDVIRQKVQNRGVLKHKAKLAALGRALPTDRLGAAVSNLKGDNPTGSLRGHGNGRGTGVGRGEGTGTLTRGTGKGPGGGGTAHADVVTQRAIKTGGRRPPKGVPGGTGLKEVGVKFSTGRPEGDFNGLTAAQVNKVVRRHKSAIRYCFDKVLQRFPNLGGKMVLTWRIDRTGRVSRAKVKSSTVRNASVESCIARQIPKWKFPTSDGTTVVRNYPFIFSRR